MITGVTLAIISTLGYRCHRDAIYSTLITADVHHFSEGVGGVGSGVWRVVDNRLRLRSFNEK